MRVLIAGAGAIGSLIGGRLAMAGHKVALLGRPAYVEHVRALGLQMTDSEGTHSITRVHADTDAKALSNALGDVDMAVVTTKVHDTLDICHTLESALGADTLVTILQNGVGGEHIASQVFDSRRLISGIITHVVSVQESGHYVMRGSKGGIGLAPVQAGRSVAEWARVLREAGLRCRTYADYRRAKWSKLLLNMMGNAIPAILDMAPDRVYAHRGLYALEMAAVREALRVMSALRVRPVAIPGYPVPTIARILSLPPRLTQTLMKKSIAGGRAGKKPSLQIDIERGRPRSEVTFLNGAVVAAGAELGLSCPANAAITDAIEGILRGTVPRTHFASSPHTLLAFARGRGYGARK